MDSGDWQVPPTFDTLSAESAGVVSRTVAAWQLAEIGIVARVYGGAEFHNILNASRFSNGPHTMKLTPLGENVIVQRVDAKETTEGGIVLPDSARERPAEGVILSVGDGRLLPDGSRHPLQVREGDRIVFISYAGSDIEVNGETLLIMRESDILAVLG
jgi:chaperonin GroES